MARDGEEAECCKAQSNKLELKHRRHEPIASVGAWLCKVTSGYFQYHAVPGNLPRRALFRWRSRVSIGRINRLVERWIPVPPVLHPYPLQGFAATSPRREPYA
jgi:RNA-directed DNA polymerase